MVAITILETVAPPLGIEVITGRGKRRLDMALMPQCFGAIVNSRIEGSASEVAERNGGRDRD